MLAMAEKIAKNIPNNAKLMENNSIPINFHYAHSWLNWQSRTFVMFRLQVRFLSGALLKKILRRYNTMTNETRISILRARMNLLQQRDPVVNANIVNKLKRKIRNLEGK